MKKKMRTLLIVIAVLGLLFSACATPTAEATRRPAPTVVVIPTRTKTPTPVYTNPCIHPEVDLKNPWLVLPASELLKHDGKSVEIVDSDRNWIAFKIDGVVNCYAVSFYTIDDPAKQLGVTPLLFQGWRVLNKKKISDFDELGRGWNEYYYGSPSGARGILKVRGKDPSRYPEDKYPLVFVASRVVTERDQAVDSTWNAWYPAFLTLAAPEDWHSITFRSDNLDPDDKCRFMGMFEYLVSHTLSYCKEKRFTESFHIDIFGNGKYETDSFRIIPTQAEKDAAIEWPLEMCFYESGFLKWRDGKGYDWQFPIKEPYVKFYAFANYVFHVTCRSSRDDPYR